jgi:hypothetical protein
MKYTTYLAPAIALAVALSLAACGGSKSSTSTTTYAGGEKTGAAGTGTMMGSKGASSAGDLRCASGDPVVWVNLKRKTIHEAGDPYYGKTKNGKYMCMSDARSMGGHMSGAKGSGAMMDGGMRHHHHKHGMPEATSTP